LRQNGACEPMRGRHSEMCRGFESGERHRLSPHQPNLRYLVHKGRSELSSYAPKDKGLRTRYQTKAAKFAEIRKGAHVRHDYYTGAPMSEVAQFTIARQGIERPHAPV
jgi:hypothetical protein